MPPESTSNAFKTALLIILPILSLVGAFGTWVLGFSNGMFVGIGDLLETKRPLLPYSGDAILRTYTGISAIDSQLQILVTFFAPVVNGSSPALTLFCVAGFGQFGAAWIMFLMEGLRTGNRGKAVSFIGTMGLIFQNFSFTITIPLYLTLHILTSPVATSHSKNALLVSTSDLNVLPVSFTLGYILPSILMILPSPSVVSPEIHQRLIAFWQAFPLWTVVFHTSIKYLISGKYKNDSSKKPLTSPGASYLGAVKHIYTFMLALCTITYMPVLAITLLPAGLLPEALKFNVHFVDVFIPHSPALSHKIQDLAEGALIFLHWDLYVGSMAVLLWALLLFRNVAAKAHVSSLLGKVTIWTLLSGPMGAVAMLLWERDTIVAQKIKQ